MDTIKINIIFHSLYGHAYALAKAIAEGTERIAGISTTILQAQETLPSEVLEKMGATDFKDSIKDVPVATPDHLAEADALFFGCGTRFGSASSQMQALFDQTGSLWQEGKLVDKLGSVFCSTGTQHGGQETTLLSMYTFLIHQGMLVAGLPYTNQGLLTMESISGGSPYGASTIAASDGSRSPSENELELAKAQGRRVAEIARKLKGR